MLRIRYPIALAVVACSFSAPSVLATIQFIDCPAWVHPTSTAYFADPGEAVVDGLNNTSQIAQACKPITPGFCTHPANDFTIFNCTDYESAQCNNSPITGQASG